MAILAECPLCHLKQSNRNKKCKTCETDLDKAKSSRRVKYWISYRLPGGKQRRESVAAIENLNGFSIEDAQDALAKRRVQKKENRVFDMLPESKMTFQELANWYLDLKTVKNLKSHIRIEQALENFNHIFGNIIVGTIRPTDLEDYQEGRLEKGKAAATIDMELSIAKTMVNKAFDNDMVDGRVLKAFRVVKRKLKPGSNARKRIITQDEYLKLIEEAPQHLKVILVTAFNTGARLGELLKLKWSNIDRKAMFIRLPASMTKESRDKNIPINHHVSDVLNSVPRAIRHDFVFTYRGASFSEGGIKRSFRTACDNANIPYGRKAPNGITFHDFRRTVKTSMLNAGVDKAHRDLIIGHRLKGMDVHYLAPSENSLRDAMDKYTRWVDGQFANVDHTVDQNEKTAQGESS